METGAALLCEQCVREVAVLAVECRHKSATVASTRHPDDWRETEPAEMSEVVELARKLGNLLLARLDA